MNIEVTAQKPPQSVSQSRLAIADCDIHPQVGVGHVGQGVLRRRVGQLLAGGKLAHTLVESYEEIQRLRLSYQLMQIGEGRHPSDRLVVARMSSIDRSILGQAVREIANAQKRLANIAAYVSPEEWVLPE